MMIELKRSRCAILPLVLKGRWYDMIASGVKREEYRLATKYWCIRLKNWDAKTTGRSTPVVEFRRGYAKDAPRMAYWCFWLETASGMKSYAYVDDKVNNTRHPEWGEPEEQHFVIRLGGRVVLIGRAQLGHQHSRAANPAQLGHHHCGAAGQADHRSAIGTRPGANPAQICQHHCGAANQSQLGHHHCGAAGQAERSPASATREGANRGGAE